MDQALRVDRSYPPERSIYRRKQHFTLVEMFVVIAVLSVLVAFLFPALQSATSKARSMICTNNLRDIGTMSFIYSNNNDGILPHDGHKFDKYMDTYDYHTIKNRRCKTRFCGLSESYWYHKLELDYQKIDGPFVCPEVPVEEYGLGFWDNVSGSMTQNYYAINQYVASRPFEEDPDLRSEIPLETRLRPDIVWYTESGCEPNNSLISGIGFSNGLRITARNHPSAINAYYMPWIWLSQLIGPTVSKKTGLSLDIQHDGNRSAFLMGDGSAKRLDLFEAIQESEEVDDWNGSKAHRNNSW